MLSNHESRNKTTEMVQVHGMHCASCAQIIQKKVKQMSGVESCQINIANGKAAISYDTDQISLEIINTQLQKIGYHFSPSSSLPQVKTVDKTTSKSQVQINAIEHSGQHQLESDEQDLKTKVAFSLPISLLFFALMTWDVLAQFFAGIPPLPLPMRLFDTIGFLLSTIVLFWIGFPYIQAVGVLIRHRVANMDSLIGIGALVAYVYSTILFLVPAGDAVEQLTFYTYFDITIVLISFVVLGKYLETKAKNRTGEAIEALAHLQLKEALVIRGEEVLLMPIESVALGDVLLVKPGSIVPLDGIVLQGSSAIDESMITGESMPVDKVVGDVVIGGTLNMEGSLSVKTTALTKDTVLSQILSLVEQAVLTKAPIERFADKIAAVFVPGVLLLAVITFVTWVVIGMQFMPLNQALALAVVSFVGVLVIACPCAMGLATPAAVTVGLGRAAQYGILIKEAATLEKIQAVNHIVMDKTGTLTKGNPEFKELIPTEGYSSAQLFQIIASLEQHSEHPIAHALTKKAKLEHIKLLSVDTFRIIPGKGLAGVIDDQQYYAGNVALATSLQISTDKEIIFDISSQGKTPLLLMNKDKVLAYVSVADAVKDEAKSVLKRMEASGIAVTMATGDNRRTAAHIGSQLGIHHVESEMLPGDKALVIQNLQQQGKVVAMIGDGVNDAPALSTADVGIVMGSGTDAAIASGDVILVGASLHKLPELFLLARATMQTIKQNLFWAFLYNILAIPIAAGVLYPSFGIVLNPALAAVAMSFSSISVVLNSLRLKHIKI